MTEYEATAIIAQLELVRKNSHYEAHNPRVDEKGRGLVEIVTTADQPSISRWFKQVGCMVTRVQSLPNTMTRLVWFDWY